MQVVFFRAEAQLRVVQRHKKDQRMPGLPPSFLLHSTLAYRIVYLSTCVAAVDGTCKDGCNQKDAWDLEAQPTQMGHCYSQRALRLMDRAGCKSFVTPTTGGRLNWRARPRSHDTAIGERDGELKGRPHSFRWSGQLLSSAVFSIRSTALAAAIGRGSNSLTPTIMCEHRETELGAQEVNECLSAGRGRQTGREAASACVTWRPGRHAGMRA